jgi:hypothetical protein
LLTLMNLLKAKYTDRNQKSHLSLERWLQVVRN